MKKLTRFWLRGSLVFLLLVVLLAVDIWNIPCPFRQWVGIPCPGCGMTRAWRAMLRLDITAAFSYHPLFWTIPLLLFYLWKEGRVFGEKADTWLLGSLAVSLFVLWGIRLILI